MAANDPDRGNNRISDALFEEAVGWLHCLRDENTDPQVRKKFQIWIQSNPLHARAYEQATSLWGALDIPARNAAQDNSAAIAELIRSARVRKSSRLGRKATVGLGIVLCLTSTGWLYTGGLDDLRADYVTGRGEHSHVILADGTTMDMNTDTAVAVDIDPLHRGIHVFRGEVFVTVSHDAAKPFTVTTTEGRIVDVGTAFNVRLKDARTIVSLVQGSINVTSAGKPERVEALNPGEEVVIDRAGLEPAVHFDETSVTAWRSGRMVFYKAPLGDVIDELNRYQRGRIIILKPSLRALPVTGVFSTQSPSEAIDVIEATLGVSTLRLSSALTILH